MYDGLPPRYKPRWYSQAGYILDWECTVPSDALYLTSRKKRDGTESCGTLLPLGRAWQMKFSRNREWTKLNTLSGLYLNEGGTQTTAMPRHKRFDWVRKKNPVQQKHKVRARTFRHVMGSFWVSIWYQLNACARARGGGYICRYVMMQPVAFPEKKSPKKCPTTTTDHIHASEQRSYSLRTSANEPDQKQYSESKLSRKKKPPQPRVLLVRSKRRERGYIAEDEGGGKDQNTMLLSPYKPNYNR